MLRVRTALALSAWRRPLSTEATCATTPAQQRPPTSDATTTRQKLEFPGADGLTRLAALLETPATDPNPKAFALFAHCFTCGKDVMAAKYISAALTKRGFGCLRFDFTGLGMSDGEFANTNFSSNVGDLIAASSYLRDNYRAPQLLVGHSLGGAAVLHAAEKIPESTAVAVVGAPFDPSHVLHNFHADLSEIEKTGHATVTLAGRPFTVKKQFLDDVRAEDGTADKVKRLHKALLVMHAPLDDTVGIDNASQTFFAAKHPKSFVSLDGANHLLSNRKDALYAGDVIATWAQRYIRV